MTQRGSFKIEKTEGLNGEEDTKKVHSKCGDYFVKWITDHYIVMGGFSCVSKQIELEINICTWRSL